MLGARLKSLIVLLRSAFGSTACGEIEDPSLKAQVRGKQVATIVRITPQMMAANALNAGMICYVLWPTELRNFVALWTLGLWLLAAYAIADWYFRLRKLEFHRASLRSVRRLAIHATILGSLWGLLLLAVYPFAGFGAKLLLTALGAGMAGGGCLVLYVSPRAMHGWLGSIYLGMAGALLLSGQPSDYPTLVLATIYIVSLIRAGHTAAETFNQNSIAAITIRDQAATIQMLLTDFSESARDWLWEMNAEGRLTRGRQQFIEHAGMAFDGKGSGALGLWLKDPLNAESAAQLKACFDNRTSFRNVLLATSNSEARRWISFSGKPVLDEMGAFAGFRGVASDVTEIHRAENRINYLAYHDALTGLANRTSFTNALTEKVARADPLPVALLFLDLDGFKAVNDQFGHAMGDRLLVEVAGRLREIVPDGDTAARLGGDEFAILSSQCASRARAAELATRLVAEISQPYTINGATLRISVSIGISISAGGVVPPAEWINQADLALYRAKDEGKAGHRFYEPAMDEIVRHKRKLELDLRKAVSGSEIGVAFQPYLDTRTSAIAGFEALARWNHPEIGPVPPSDFIPIAERAGLIGDIGDMVMEKACRAAASWPADLKLAINLSPQQLQSGRVQEQLERILAESALPAGNLELEITESTFIDNGEHVIDCLRRLKQTGVAIALDDFGTGYAALGYLLRFPFDKLKIDRSFIAPSTEDRTARQMLETIMKLANALGLTVTAEGIETAEQAALLSAMGSRYLQGFHLAKPMEESEIAAWLLRRTGDNLQAASYDTAMPAHQLRSIRAL